MTGSNLGWSKNRKTFTSNAVQQHKGYELQPDTRKIISDCDFIPLRFLQLYVFFNFRFFTYSEE